MPGSRDFDERPERAGGEADVRHELGKGEPLDGASRSRWEWVFGRDLESVRVHSGDAADRVAAREGATAFAIGDDIGFRSGAYRPGTLAGDALVAHELAHVAQQETAGTGAATHDGAVEADANMTAVGALARLAGAGAAVAPRLRTGASLRLASCNPQTEPPSYLGPASRDALRDIDRITGSGNALQMFILFGTVASMSTSSPEENAASGVDVTPQAQAISAVPVIVFERVNTRIDLLMLDHENDMNDEEKAFWQRMRDRSAQAQQHASTRSTAAQRATP